MQQVELMTQQLMNEIADNWPAFIYIGMMIVFSIFFLRERRAETRVLKDIGIALQGSIRTRFDRLEHLVERSAGLRAQVPENSDR